MLHIICTCVNIVATARLAFLGLCLTSSLQVNKNPTTRSRRKKKKKKPVLSLISDSVKPVLCHCHQEKTLAFCFILHYFIFFSSSFPSHASTQTLMEIFPLVTCTVMAGPCLCASALYSTLLYPIAFVPLWEDAEMSDLHPSTQRLQLRPPSFHPQIYPLIPAQLPFS